MDGGNERKKKKKSNNKLAVSKKAPPPSCTDIVIEGVPKMISVSGAEHGEENTADDISAITPAYAVGDIIVKEDVIAWWRRSFWSAS